MTECEDIPNKRDGVYTIYPGGGERTTLVYCIMRQTKKWTVSNWFNLGNLCLLSGHLSVQPFNS